MSGALGSIAGILAPIAGGALGSAGGELLGNLFGSTATSFLTPTILADIGGGVGGAAAGALTNKNHLLGALTGGVEGALTGPGITNLTGISSALTGGHVTPILDSLFGGAGWGRGSPGTSLAAAGAAGSTATGGGSSGYVSPPGGNENAMAGIMGERAAAQGLDPTAVRDYLYTGSTSVPGLAGAVTNLLGAGQKPLGVTQPQVGSTQGAAQQAAGGAAAGTAGTAGAAGAAGGAGGLLGGTGGILGSGITVPELLAGLGLGAAALKGNKQPYPSQVNQLAAEAMGIAPLANSLQSGRLPPGAESFVDTALQDSRTDIAGRYASLGLSGSTMEAQDMAAAQQRAEGMKFQIAQQTTQTGMAAMQLADTIYNQIANYNLGQDQSLQNALAQFAAAASGGAPSTDLGTQYGTAA